MSYIPLIAVIIFGIYYYIDKNKELTIKRSGIKVPGVIIDIKGSSGYYFSRLGGNINTPIIRFFTENGEEVVGKPIIGFISQREFQVPTHVIVIYDRKDPNKFCIADN